MGWRKTGTFRPQQEILVMTCDVCECDIGYEDGKRPQQHYELSQIPNRGAIDNQNPPIVMCSVRCLRAFAAGTPTPQPSQSEQAKIFGSTEPSGSGL